MVLVDGSSLIFRAFFAIPGSFTTAAGLKTNASYGFALMFRRILAGRFPDAGAVVFDAPGGTFRDELFAEYKAERPPMADDLVQQLPWIDKLVHAHDFPLLRVPGYEADDVIGTLAKQAVDAGMEVVIVAGDKDFAQLIGPDVRMLDTMRDVTYDAELVRKKWGVPPAQFIDFLALMGDKIDNVPGVPGIGKKTAATLLERFGDLDTILASTDQLKGRQQANLREFAEQARLSRTLVTIDQAVPLELGVADLHLTPVEPAKVNALYKELEFYSLLGQDQQADAVELTVDVVDTMEGLHALVDALPSPVAVEGVFEGPNPVHGALVGLAVCGAGDRGAYVPLFDDAGGLGAEGLAVLTPWLRDRRRLKVGHGLRDLVTGLLWHRVQLKGLAFDTGLASFLVDPTGNLPHRLGQICKHVLQRTLPQRKTLTGSGKSEILLAAVDRAAVAEFAVLRAQTIWTLFPELQERVAAAEQGEQLGRDLQLAQVLGRMQHVGVRIDAAELEAMQVEFSARKVTVEGEIHALAGHPFNIGSTKQLANVLFEELGLPVIKRTKTGYSTNAEVLERLAPDHPICEHILRWRALAKLINTYTQVLRDAQRADTGRIHCQFQQTVGVSGRLITTEPDLQRTPIRSGDGVRIRQAFIPRQGWVLVSADWSQIELRVLAHFCQDPNLLESFRTGGDVHARTASVIFGVPQDQVDREQRTVGKTVNFATIYGQGATALGQQLGMTRGQAQKLIATYFERYAAVKDWVDGRVKQAYAHGYVSTLLGRRRIVRELTSRNWSERGYGERIAANTPIQGSAADLCKQAMLGIDAELQDRGMQTRMVLQIHDELLFECPPDELESLMEVVRRQMESPPLPDGLEISVPLAVDMGHGASWAEAH
jgi:DNA polymerase-1